MYNANDSCVYENLFRAFQPQIEPQSKRYPLEVLEAEHGLEAGVPEVGCEAEVRGAGIIFKNKLRVEPAVAEPDGTPGDCGTGSVVVGILTEVVLIAHSCANLAPGRGEVLCDHNIHVSIR